MTTSAIVMMVIAMLVVWGGLALAIRNISRTTREEPDEVRRDL
jgi:cell division protein FtsX